MPISAPTTEIKNLKYFQLVYNIPASSFIDLNAIIIDYTSYLDA